MLACEDLCFSSDAVGAVGFVEVDIIEVLAFERGIGGFLEFFDVVVVESGDFLRVGLGVGYVGDY